MPMPEVPQDLSGLSLAQIATLASKHKLPPVDTWNPEREGDSEMRIARDGRWYHQGGEITRPNMVRLFSTILRREPDGRHVLVTPAEKLFIEVEDAAFVAVEVKSEGEGQGRTLAFRLNTGDLAIAGPDNALRFDGEAPHLAVRGGMDAVVARGPYYELAEWAIAEANEPPGLWSNGAFFEMPAA